MIDFNEMPVRGRCFIGKITGKTIKVVDVVLFDDLTKPSVIVYKDDSKIYQCSRQSFKSQFKRINDEN